MIQKISMRYKELFIYSAIAILIGIVVGIITGIFGRTLYAIREFREVYILYLLPFLPLAGYTIVWLYEKFSYESVNGLSIVFKTGLGERKQIPKLLVPLIIIATLLTNLFGASAGREGAAVQIGSSTGYALGQRFKLAPDKSMFIVIGLAAGFAGLFRTPLGATFFALEVIIAGIMMYEALVPTLLASYTAYFVSGLFGLQRMRFSINKNVDTNYIINLDWTFILKLFLLALIFGVVGVLFSHTLRFFKKKLKKYFPDSKKKMLYMSILLAVLIFILHAGRYAGAGDNLLYEVYHHGTIYWYDWAFKLLLTTLTLAIGFHGGEVVPLFSIGSALGYVIAPLIGLPPSFVAALGLVAVFSSATNTMIAPILLAVEVFGPEYIMYFMVICCLSYAFHSHRSIYSAQERYHFFPEKLYAKDEYSE